MYAFLEKLMFNNDFKLYMRYNFFQMFVNYLLYFKNKKNNYSSSFCKIDNVRSIRLCPLEF